VIETIEAVRPYTKTSPERIEALCSAVSYIVRKPIPGCIVECGVWRGGSMMAAALTLLREGVSDRDLYLFDTFVGMTPPGARDIDYRGDAAAKTWSERDLLEATGRDSAEEMRADVRRAMESTGYPPARIHLIEGPVETTIPRSAPEQIALLRLDTDWYQSTRHELMHLYPRLVGGGVLIVDDYGHYRGARQAVEEHFARNPVLLHRIDYTGRCVVKLPGHS
jgi:hypothetical protein